MTVDSRPIRPTSRRDLALRLWMASNGVLAMVAAVGGAAAAAGAPDEQVVLEWWRAIGFVVFAALWFVVAVRPRSAPGVWEVIVLHKVAMSAVGLLLPSAAGAATVAAVDGYLALSTAIAYVGCRGWLGWSSRPCTS